LSCLKEFHIGIPNCDKNYHFFYFSKTLKMRRHLQALLCILVCSFGSLQAQISIPSTTAVKQNFDGMSTTRTLPTGWRMAVTTSSPVFSSGVDTVMQQASSGSPSTGGTYNWGSSSSERAVGVMTSSSFASNSILINKETLTNYNPDIANIFGFFY